MEQEKDTQLPAEWLEEIKLSARAFAGGMWPADTKHDEKQREYVAAVHKAGTTVYATKLYQAQQEIEELKRWKDEAKKLLEKVIHRHEGGLLPDRLLYNEIKSFLDGTKH
jgi:hypothetical protein